MILFNSWMGSLQVLQLRVKVDPVVMAFVSLFYRISTFVGSIGNEAEL